MSLFVSYVYNIKYIYSIYIHMGVIVRRIIVRGCLFRGVILPGVIVRGDCSGVIVLGCYCNLSCSQIFRMEVVVMVPILPYYYLLGYYV